MGESHIDFRTQCVIMTKQDSPAPPPPTHHPLTFAHSQNFEGLLKRELVSGVLHEIYRFRGGVNWGE